MIGNELKWISRIPSCRERGIDDETKWTQGEHDKCLATGTPQLIIDCSEHTAVPSSSNELETFRTAKRLSGHLRSVLFWVIPRFEGCAS